MLLKKFSGVAYCIFRCYYKIFWMLHVTWHMWCCSWSFTSSATVRYSFESWTSRASKSVQLERKRWFNNPSFFFLYMTLGSIKLNYPTSYINGRREYIIVKNKIGTQIPWTVIWTQLGLAYIYTYCNRIRLNSFNAFWMVPYYERAL